jgi:hypothetical protein
MNALRAGDNPLSAKATTAFGQAATTTLTVTRVLEGDPAAGPAITIDSPLEGFSSGGTSVPVKGHVNQPGLLVKVQGQTVGVDPITLRFETTSPVTAGFVTLTATATDAQARTATATVHGQIFAPGTAHYRWDLPTTGTRTKTRTVHITGQADLPGIASVTVNGAPLGLSGSGATGKFEGDVTLPAKGTNPLLLDVLTLAGERFTERRDVVFEPDLPRLRLSAPDTARPGDSVDLQAQPEAGTNLASVDLSWNGALVAHLASPFPPQKALVPMDALVGSKLLVEAFGKDIEGETVTARTYVTVLGAGILVVEAYSDRTGLALTGGTASVEGTSAAAPLDDSGRAALPTALPQNWLRIEKPGHSPVWRSAALQVGGVAAVVDARLTPLETGQEAGPTSFNGTFADGGFKVTFPVTALTGTGKLSLTPLSTQGLPGLLPSGWSAVAGAWLSLEGVSISSPGTLELTLPTGAPEQELVWAHWDPANHVWVAIGTGLNKAQLLSIPLPSAGGYALLVADPAPTAPPGALVNASLEGTLAAHWREGLAATGNVTPSVLPTTAAIAGAKASATFNLSFANGLPIPSGALIQTDVLETYTLASQALIEPERRTQDGVADRFAAVIDEDGKPAVKVATSGLVLELPLRMTRTFSASELIEGLIRVAFYHDGVQLAQGGTLLDAAGGTVARDGVTVTFDAGAFAGPTLVRLNADPGSTWPELSGQGFVKSPFMIDIVGKLSLGLKLRVEDLGAVDGGMVPILVQRRIVQGQSLALAVGAFERDGTGWKLVVPAAGNPILEGGAFCVLVPNKAWAWVSGTVTMPKALAMTIQQALTQGPEASSFITVHHRSSPVKKRNEPVMNGINGDKDKKQLSVSPTRNLGFAATSTDDVAVADALLSGNFLSSTSGPTGAFATPAFTPITGKLTLTGSRWDLGVKGSLEVDVPSSANPLRLATVPFLVLNVLPAENTEVGLGSIAMVLLSAPADPTSLGSVRLLKGITEITARRDLSLDGRTLLLTPERALEAGSTYKVEISALKGLTGDTAPTFTRTFRTATPIPPVTEAVEFSRINLSYPDSNFNFTVTIPAGVIPPGAGLSLEGLGLGSTYAGSMPLTGEARIPFKASLGERIKVTVQFASGRILAGYVSRYEATDGSGRVTVGVDGGRVEATDGCSH